MQRAPPAARVALLCSSSDSDSERLAHLASCAVDPPFAPERARTNSANKPPRGPSSSPRKSLRDSSFHAPAHAPADPIQTRVALLLDSYLEKTLGPSLADSASDFSPVSPASGPSSASAQPPTASNSVQGSPSPKRSVPYADVKRAGQAAVARTESSFRLFNNSTPGALQMTRSRPVPVRRGGPLRKKRKIIGDNGLSPSLPSDKPGSVLDGSSGQSAPAAAARQNDVVQKAGIGDAGSSSSEDESGEPRPTSALKVSVGEKSHTRSAMGCTPPKKRAKIANVPSPSSDDDSDDADEEEMARLRSVVVAITPPTH